MSKRYAGRGPTGGLWGVIGVIASAAWLGSFLMLMVTWLYLGEPVYNPFGVAVSLAVPTVVLIVYALIGAFSRLEYDHD